MLGLIICATILSVVNLIDATDKKENLFTEFILIAINVYLLIGFFVFRGFSLRAQDRAIRAEENFRHFILTGKPLDPRLHTTQVVALRFAPDDEFIYLAKEAADNKLSSDEIKKSIKRWKGDYHRA